MFLTIILFSLGFILLIKGADILIDGSSSIAKKYRISTFCIGLTIIAFGTSAPELVVNVLASIKGSSGVVFGNIIGANITNILLILGISAILAPLIIKKATINKEILFSVLAILALGFLVNDSLFNGAVSNVLTRTDGLILILFFSIFIYYVFGVIKENFLQKTIGELKQEIIKEYSNLTSIIMVVAGLTGLVIGGKWVVAGAINFVQIFGVSEILIGSTVIAIGTTLPELTASITAVKKNRFDMAVGNVIGSNIFNLLWILGISSTVRQINYNSILNIDLIILFVITILLLFLIYVGKKNILGRKEGIVLLCLYVGYIGFLIYRG